MAGSTRGFLGRRRDRDPRLPPGQYDVGSDWPVLTAEPTPRIAPETWSITVDGRVENADHLDLGRGARPARRRSTAATSTA